MLWLASGAVVNHRTDFSVVAHHVTSKTWRSYLTGFFLNVLPGLLWKTDWNYQMQHLQQRKLELTHANLPTFNAIVSTCQCLCRTKAMLTALTPSFTFWHSQHWGNQQEAMVNMPESLNLFRARMEIVHFYAHSPLELRLYSSTKTKLWA